MANGEIIGEQKINLKTVEIGGFLLKNISASVIYKQMLHYYCQSALSNLVNIQSMWKSINYQ